MPIRIRREENRYLAEVTPPHGRGVEWTSDSPMTLDDLIKRLQSLGCHQTDIGDALTIADPEWLSRGGI